MRYGYARISTREQDEARQIEVLRQAGVQEIIIEKASGKNFIDRTEWQKLMAKVVVDEVIVVKSLDRLGRNNAEIKETFELSSKKQVYLEFIDNAILNTKAVTEAEKLNKNPFLESMEYKICRLLSSLSPLCASSKRIYHWPPLS